jgi:hypothetical protein
MPPVGMPPVGEPPVGEPPVGEPPVLAPPVGTPPVLSLFDGSSSPQAKRKLAPTMAKATGALRILFMGLNLVVT